MANMPHKFKDTDIQRVIKAARRGGLVPTAVEVYPNIGKIKVIGGKAAAEQANDLDREIAEFEARNG